MKLKKAIVLVLIAAFAAFAAAGLSACDFLDGLLGKTPDCVHEYGEWLVTEDTCTRHTETRTCVLCNEDETRELTPKGHNFGEWEDVTLTCTEHTQKRACKECNKEETKKLAPKGHNFGDWKDVTLTCTEHTQKRACKDCNEEETQQLTPDGHSFGQWKDEEVSCTVHTQKRNCLVCKVEENRQLPADGHRYGEWTDKINTCFEHVQTSTCSACGDVKTLNLPAAGHSYGEWVDTVNTCLKHMQKQICSACGDEIEREVKASGHKFAQGLCEYCNTPFYDGDYSVLEKYNSTYGYNYFVNNNLTAQKTLYERIDAVARAFHVDGTADAQAKVLSRETVYCVSSVKYAELGLTSGEAASVWKTFRDDNPLYYWLSSQMAYTSESLDILCIDEYAQGAERAAANEFVYNKVTEYSLSYDLGDTAYRKALAFHDKIISVIDYAYDEQGNPQSAAWAHNIMGVLEERGAVCEGYAKTFQLLLNYNGVENMFVTGTGNAEAHAWNLVRLDNGEWYWCDLTWDDTPSWEWGISYNYFLVNDTQKVNWSDGGRYYGYDANFLDSHKPDTPFGEDVNFLYSLPERAAAIYKDNKYVTLRQTFTVDGNTYAVSGYNTVQLVKNETAGAITVPETVTYQGITYTVISIGSINKDGLFGSDLVFKGATSVFIPKTVKFIWDNAMICSTNSRITVDAENKYFCSVDGVLFTKSMKTLVNYPANRAGGEYSIPEQTVWLATGAFSLTKNLSRLYVGKNVVANGIACWGVYYDNSRNTVSGGWRRIAYDLKRTENTGIIVDEENPAFSSDEKWLYNKDKTKAYCYFNREATEIEIPASVTSFDDSIFMNYMNLERFTVADGNTAFAVRDGVLYNKDFTEIVYIPVKVSGTVTLPATITRLGDGIDTSFSNCHITEINISVTLKYLGNFSFSRPYSLERINYGGTTEQWLAIEKNKGWVSGTEKFVIVCTDGVLDVHGNRVTV